MGRVLRVATEWFDEIEAVSDGYIGPPERCWSWFQIAWTGLHATAVVMHVLSTVYHARRVQGEPGREHDTAARLEGGAPPSFARRPDSAKPVKPAELLARSA